MVIKSLELALERCGVVHKKVVVPSECYSSVADSKRKRSAKNGTGRCSFAEALYSLVGADLLQRSL